MVRHAVRGHTHHTTATQGCLEPMLYLQPSRGHGHPILTPPLSSLGPHEPPVHAAMWTQDRTCAYTTVHSPCLRFILSTDSVILGNLAFGVPHIFQSPSVRMWSVLWLGGGCPVGRRIRFLFPAPTHSAPGGDREWRGLEGECLGRVPGSLREA